MDDVKLNQYLVTDKATIKEVAAWINQTRLSFAVVIDGSGRLVGTVTDGDLRRAYLADKKLDQSVRDIMCQRPVTVTVGASQEEMLRVMRRHRLQHLPILDPDGRPIDVFRLNQEVAKSDTFFRTAVIMAGGEGRRLRPLTESIPKPMIPVNGRPVLEQIVEGLAKEGAEKVYLAVNYKADMIESYFEDGSRFGVSIDYLRESKRMGTAGGLSLLGEVPSDPLIVINGDVLTSVNYKDFFAFHVKHRCVMTVAATEYRVNVPYGALELANQFLIRIAEKPEVRFHCNAGVYALEPEAFHYVQKNRFYDMTDLIEDVMRDGLPISVFPIHEYWLDIGRPEDLEKAQNGVGPPP